MSTWARGSWEGEEKTIETGLIWSGLNLISLANGHYCRSADAGGICVKTRLDWTWSPLRPVWCKQSSPVSWSAPTDSSLKRTPRRSPSPPSPWIREQKAADCCCNKRAETEIENGSSWFHRWSPPDNLCGSNFIAKFIPPSLRFDPFHHPSHSFVFF